MVEIDVIDVLHLCRCCLRRPPDKDLTKPYTHLGKTETYSDVLAKCFDISLSLDKNDECGICEVCMGRLRDASDFKQQVQRSQAVMHKWLDRVLLAMDEVQEDESKTVQEEADCMEDDNILTMSPLNNADAEVELPEASHATDQFPVAFPEILESFCSEEPNASVQETRHHEIAPPVSVTIERLETPYQTHEIENNQCDDSNKHTGDKLYKCKRCKKQFSQKCSLNRHLLHRACYFRYSCDICENEYKHKINLDVHLRTMHKKISQHICNLCKQGFNEKSLLKKHLCPEEKQASREPITCDICRKVIKQRLNFIEHMNAHLGVKPFSCNVCFKQFTYSSAYKRHILTHTGEKRYGCEVCQKRFTRKAILRDHMLIHQGLKLLACTVCKKEFRLKNTLDIHMLRVHTDERPFTCDECGKSFAQFSGLRHHHRTHTGEKPYECEICQKKFTRVDKVKKHIVDVHKEEPSKYVIIK